MKYGESKSISPWKLFFTCSFLLTGILAITISGISNNETQYDSNPASTISVKTRQHLVRAIHAFPSSLDPHAEGFDSKITRDLMEGLIEEDVEGHIVPAGALSWSMPDARNYIFKLSPEVKWANGDPVMAHDYVSAWRRASNPESASSCGAYIAESNVKNGREVLAGARIASDLGVKAIDSMTLHVTLEESTESFLFRLTSHCFLPIHSSTFTGESTGSFRPEHHISNGPFRIDEWRPGTVKLVKNRKYAHTEQIKLERVDYFLIPSGKSQMNRYRAGDIDISVVPIETSRSFRKKMKNELINLPINNETFGFAINHEHGQLSDPNLRKALSYALDRKVLSGFIRGSEAYSFLPPRLPPMIPVQNKWEKLSQAAREERARQALMSTGYSEQDLPPIKMVYMRNDFNHKLAVAATAMWKRVLGIEVDLVQLEARSLYEKLATGDYDITPYGLWASYNEASAILAGFVAGDHALGYSNQHLAQLIRQAQTTPSIGERRQYYAAAEKILIEDMPFIPVLRGSGTALVKPYVRGFHPDIRGQVRSKALWIDSIQLSVEG